MRWGGAYSRIQFAHSYENIISVENLLAAWREFVRGKRKKKDVQEFQYKLMDNVLDLHRDLRERTYHHGSYEAFKISDPKPRDIHKATVRDRLLHHALYRKLYPFFDRTFIADSYSCRRGKGTHRAMNRFRSFAAKVSRNHTRTCWVLKCDIRKFFASIDHETLLDIVRGYIPDTRIVSLISAVVGSFSAFSGGLTSQDSARAATSPQRLRCPIGHAKHMRNGLPLGNLTSQLLVNVYMNEFDRFVKHRLKSKYYIRYADDFVLMSSDREELVELLPTIRTFLSERLCLDLHPHKVSISTFASGVDFLGWVHFPDHRVLRGSTKRRMMRRVGETDNDAVVDSYLGLLSHGNACILKRKVRARSTSF